MEALMQYIWQYRLWPLRAMRTVDGRRVEVLDPGILNKDAGPDFFNAKVLIDGTSWAGNVEIHVRASDWLRHGHDRDLAYDSVVLHVVEKDDMPIRRSSGEVIPQMVMECDPRFSERYSEMVYSPTRELPCADELAALPQIIVTDALTAVAMERLIDKSDRVRGLVERYQGNWSDAVYVTLARALGFGTNAEPFQMLALTTPLKHMLRYSDSLLSIEAILFGQAGLLPEVHEGDEAYHYAQRLVEEYRFLQVKYGLQPSQNIMWKMARMRPQNFPHRRIATLAMMIYKNFTLASRMLGVESEAEARALFDIDLTGFWARHYNFSPTAGAGGVKALSYTSATVLLINVVAPVLYAYGEAIGDHRRQEQAVALWEGLKPERNSIVDVFERAGLKADSAFATQAMIQLRREYCSARKCLFCRIGHRLLSEKTVRKAP